MYKIGNFLTTQILREIIYCDFRVQNVLFMTFSAPKNIGFGTFSLLCKSANCQNGRLDTQNLLKLVSRKI